MKSKITCEEVRIVDDGRSILEFVASDETLDSYNEVIRADGWRFNLFAKNAPFADSHSYGTVLNVFGTVTGWEVSRKRLLNQVQFATAIPENVGARYAYNMYKGGFLKGVSVGFKPVRSVSRYSAGENFKEYEKELARLKLPEGSALPHRIYIEHEQIELSAVVIGANPNAVIMNSARAYRAQAIGDPEIEWIAAQDFAPKNETAPEAIACEASRASRRTFLNAFDKRLETLKRKN